MYDPTSPENDNNRIEFIARPLGYNNQPVETKSAANDFENAIYSCYLLVFDNDEHSLNYGNLIQMTEASLNENIRLEARTASNVKACFLINVTKTFVENIKALNKPDDESANPNHYLNTAVIDIEYSDHTASDSNPETKGIIGIPSVDFGGSIGTKKCLPMYGEWSGTITGKTIIQIPIKRLFSKVSVSLKMNRSDINALANSYFEIKSYNINNLPKKVKLVSSSSESLWATHKDPELYHLSFDNKNKSLLNDNLKLYNQGSTLSSFQEFTFSFYAPEYYVSPTKSITNKPEFKPLNVDKESKCPIYLSLIGAYRPLRGNDTNLTYDIYLGNNNTDNFSLTRNTHYINYLEIRGMTNHSTQTDESYIDHRVHAENEFDVIKLFGETANCYLVKEVGTVRFPAIKGVFKGDIQGDNVPWCECDSVKAYTTDNSNIKLSTPTYDPTKREITFDVESMANGNVVIVIYHNDEIEWSWHFWLNSGFEIFNAELSVANHEYPNGSTMMDRNLGAATAAVTLLNDDEVGLYYKYGDKSPYIGGAYVGGGSYGGATWDPKSDANQQDTTKAVNDPCPPGYKVPKKAVWEDFDIAGNYETTLGGYLLTNLGDYNPVNDIYYPTSGYISTSGSKVSSELDETATPFNADDYVTPVIGSRYTTSISTNQVPGPAEGSLNWLGSGTLKRKIEYTEHKYSEFIYELKFSKTRVGTLWTLDGYFYDYGTKSNNWDSFKIVSCKHETRQVTREQRQEWLFGSILVDWYTLDFDPETTPWVADPNRLTSDSSVPDSGLGTVNNSTWRTELLTDQALRDFSAYTGDYHQISPPRSSAVGYQVRCITD